MGERVARSLNSVGLFLVVEKLAKQNPVIVIAMFNGNRTALPIRRDGD